jgi:hypothetical protein
MKCTGACGNDFTAHGLPEGLGVEDPARRGREPPFSVVKRGLVTFCNSKQWTKQAAARGAENRRKGRLSARRAHTQAPYKNRFAIESPKHS